MAKIKDRKNRRTYQQMVPILEAYRSSSLKRAEFCKLHHLTVPVLSYWYTRYRKKNNTEGPSKAKFVPITLNGKQEVTSGDIQITYPDGVKVAVADSRLAIELIPFLQR